MKGFKAFLLRGSVVDLAIARSRQEPPPDSATRQCPECLSVINIAARRCAFCTAQLAPAAPPAAAATVS